MQVVVLDGREVVAVERLLAPRSPRMSIDAGRRNATHATASGRVLLDHLPPDRLDVLPGGRAAVLDREPREHLHVATAGP